MIREKGRREELNRRREVFPVRMLRFRAHRSRDNDGVNLRLRQIRPRRRIGSLDYVEQSAFLLMAELQPRAERCLRGVLIRVGVEQARDNEIHIIVGNRGRIPRGAGDRGICEHSGNKEGRLPLRIRNDGIRPSDTILMIRRLRRLVQDLRCSEQESPRYLIAEVFIA